MKSQHFKLDPEEPDMQQQQQEHLYLYSYLRSKFKKKKLKKSLWLPELTSMG